MELKIHCPTCSEAVDLYESVVQDKVEYRCVFCGQILKQEKLGSGKQLGIVLTAEDSPLLREMLKDVLIEKKLSREVTACKNGQEIVMEFTKSLKDGKIPGAVILDVVMPVMNGYFTAIALRGIEKAFPDIEPIPLVFLSAKELDKDFENVIKFCKPCYYLHKKKNQSPEELAAQIENIIAKINLDGAKQS